MKRASLPLLGRRNYITLLGGAASWPLAARAQQTGRAWRVAVIGAVSPLPAMLSAFRKTLQQRGWTEGKNLSIDVRWPKGSFAQEPGLISEVLRSNVDVIVAWATPSALAARRATSTIPIVFLGIADPAGHRRPGRGTFRPFAAPQHQGRNWGYSGPIVDIVGSTTPRPARFRTIQVRPNDAPGALRQARAVNRFACRRKAS